MAGRRGKDRGRARSLKVDRNLFTILNSVPTVGAEMEIKHMDLHSYTRPPSPDCVPLPDSMPSTPASKRGKPELTLADVQENIIKLLEKKNDERADGLEKKADGLEKLIQHNAGNIDALKENAEFLFKEIQDMKKDVTTVKKVTSDHEKRISELEDKVNDAERYQRRWNLRLHGLPEQEGEDVKQRVVDVCRAVVPDLGDPLHLHIDITHRVGRRSEDKVRPIIILFTFRATK